MVGLASLLLARRRAVSEAGSSCRLSAFHVLQLLFKQLSLLLQDQLVLAGQILLVKSLPIAGARGAAFLGVTFAFIKGKHNR